MILQKKCWAIIRFRAPGINGYTFQEEMCKGWSFASDLAGKPVEIELYMSVASPFTFKESVDPRRYQTNEGHGYG